MGQGTKIYVVDDDEAVRDSLSLQLDAAGFSVTAFSGATEFLKEVSMLPAGCVIADVRMPEIDGIELQHRLARMNINFPVIIMTGHGDVALAVRAMKAGAVDFIEKPFTEETMLESVRLAQSRFAEVRASETAAEAVRERLALLTPREHDVFEELVQGKQNKVIAANLNISPRTVEVHRARVLEKLQAHSLSDLVRMALAAGMTINS